MKDEIRNIFDNNFQENNTSIEMKLEKLNLNKNDKLKLKNMSCNTINVCEEDSMIGTRINLIDLVGINRPNHQEKNWLECLESIHKMYMFTKFKGVENFKRLLNDKDLINSIGIPIVTEYNGKYYISGDGRHRLTIGKCIGIKTALVAVKKQNKLIKELA